ncbi:hypothetical protein ACG74X_11430 [Marivita sp. S0852]|uniref:hypothetical protein n=1 Tax=Marivita sp. S0852 TaxID=3373893 RepID=UPI00398202CE
MQSQIRITSLPVDGRGTRLLPATKSIPNERLPVHDRPLSQYVVGTDRAAGIENL